MNKMFTVSAFGHRVIDDWNVVQQKVDRMIAQIIDSQENVLFLVGRDGDFDHIVASAVRKEKRRTGREDIILRWVMPYRKAEYLANQESFDEYFDEVEICECSASVHPKAAFLIRNKEMVNRSNLVICFIKHDSGGAYEILKYAEKMKKTIIRVTEDI